MQAYNKEMKNKVLKLNQLKSFAEDKHVKQHKKAFNHKVKFMGLNQHKSFAMEPESASDQYEKEQETGDDYVENMQAFNKDMKNKELKLMQRSRPLALAQVRDPESASDKYEKEQETGDDYIENMKAFNKKMQNKELRLAQTSSLIQMRA